MLDCAALQFDQKRMFLIRQNGGRELRTIKHGLDLAGRVALGQRQPCQQPIARDVTAPVPRQPPAKPCTMPKNRIEQFQHRTPVLVAKISPCPRPGGDHSIGGACRAVEIVHEIKGGLQAGGRGHGETVRLKTLWRRCVR